MHKEINDLAYLVTCVNYLNGLISRAQEERYLTPAAATRLTRWKYVRRSLMHDIEKQRQALGAPVQLMLLPCPSDQAAAYEWSVKQQKAFTQEKKNDPLNESVSNVSTLSRKGL